MLVKIAQLKKENDVLMVKIKEIRTNLGIKVKKNYLLCERHVESRSKSIKKFNIKIKSRKYIER